MTCKFGIINTKTCLNIYSTLSISLLLCDESYNTNRANLFYSFRHFLRGTVSCLRKCPKSEFLHGDFLIDN